MAAPGFFIDGLVRGRRWLVVLSAPVRDDVGPRWCGSLGEDPVSAACRDYRWRRPSPSLTFLEALVWCCYTRPARIRPLRPLQGKPVIFGSDDGGTLVCRFPLEGFVSELGIGKRGHWFAAVVVPRLMWQR